MSNEPCPLCGAPVEVIFGPDLRFNGQPHQPTGYRAQCSGEHTRPTYTRDTPEQALEVWNEKARQQKEHG